MKPKTLARICFLIISCVLFVGIILWSSTRGYRLRGYTIANFGASIYGNTKNHTSISARIQQKTGAYAYNLGFGGARMTSTEQNTREAFSMVRIAEAVVSGDYSYQYDAIQADRLNSRPYLHAYYKNTIACMEAIDFTKVDIVTIGYGSNDFTAKLPLDDPSDKYNTETFMGAIRYSVELLHNAYPNLHIYLCTPTYRFWREDGKWSMDSNNCEAVYGYTLMDYRDAELAYAKEAGDYVKTIDLYTGINLCKETCERYYGKADGTHPNAAGREQIAKKISKDLNDDFYPKEQ